MNNEYLNNENNEEMDEIWNLAGNYQYAESQDNDAAWNAFKEQLTQEKPATLRVSWMSKYKMAIAACAILVAGAMFLFWPTNKGGDIAVEKPVLPTIFKAGNAETKVITLADGSEITLNANSSLSVSANFNTKNRQIILIGEAKFEVAKNANLPFEVTANNTKTTVLGTGFVINAYDKEVKIAVNHGKVKFEASKNSEILTQNLAAVCKDETVSLIQNNEVAQAWVNGNIESNSRDLQNVIQDLNRYYGVKFNFPNDFAKEKRRINISLKQTPDEVAAVLSDVFGTSITIEKSNK